MSSNWLSTALTSMGATLAGALLLWIASNQLTIATSQAILSAEFNSQARILQEYTTHTKLQDDELREWFKQVWPRLRTHGENIVTLKSELEDLCDCTIRLEEPDKF